MPDIYFNDLKHRIAIFNKQVSRDILGGEVTVKQLWHQCWAHINPKIMPPTYSNAVSQDHKICEFIIRFKQGVEAQMLIDLEGDVYEIQTVEWLENKKWMRCTGIENGVYS